MSQTAPTRRFTSQSSAAAHFQTSVRSIRNWIGAGHIKGYRLAPRKIVVDLDEIEQAFTMGKIRDPRKAYGPKSKIVNMSNVVLPVQDSDR